MRNKKRITNPLDAKDFLLSDKPPDRRLLRNLPKYLRWGYYSIILIIFLSALLIKPNIAQIKVFFRETEVASLVHEGMTNKQIARQLGISEFHARDLVSKVYQKSNTQSRAEFAVWFERYKIKSSKI